MGSDDYGLTRCVLRKPPCRSMLLLFTLPLWLHDRITSQEARKSRLRNRVRRRLDYLAVWVSSDDWVMRENFGPSRPVKRFS